MKLTKPILKQIIKESIEDEYKEKLLTIFNAGNHQQAIELSKQVGMEDFLVGADLTGVDLEGANLTGTILTGANLTGVDLEGANLTGANLEGADLFSANLYRTNLTDADLSDADLSNIKHDKGTIWPEGFTP